MNTTRAASKRQFKCSDLQDVTVMVAAKSGCSTLRLCSSDFSVGQERFLLVAPLLLLVLPSRSLRI